MHTTRTLQTVHPLLLGRKNPISFTTQHHFRYTTMSNILVQAAHAESASATSSSSSSSSNTTAKSSLIQPTFVNGLYGNPWDTYEVRTFKHVFKWMTTAKRAPLDHKALNESLPVELLNWEVIHNPAADKIQCTWIGHASMLVQMEGVNILTDPVWSERCSMVQFAGPKRIRPTPCTLKELPKIDAVVISHNHYDHLDYNTVKALGNTPRWFVPKGVKAWFTGMGIDNVVELSWWEEAKLTENIKFVCTPCQHWSKRTPFDDNKVLWSSWAMIGASKRFFFTGDTGYCSGFQEIGRELGPFDLAAIPIGAYEPRWFMKPQHVNPEEAVQIHIDLRARNSLGMHWGTFVLTDEDALEPPKKLIEAKQQKNVPLEDFVVLNIGGMKVVG